MRINEHPKMALATLVVVFLLVLTLSLYFSSQSATGPQADQVTVSSNGDVHIVYVEYNGYCNVTFVSGSSYVHWHCIYNN